MQDRPDNVNIYILYAQEDEDLKRELERHLSSLQRLGYIDVWHEGLVEAGAERDQVVAEYLRRAHLILLLISANFLSPDCYDKYERELRLAYQRQERGEVKIIPVILRPCLWQTDILAHLNPLPRGGHPVGSSHWESKDSAFQQIALELQSLVDGLKRAWRQAVIPRKSPVSVPGPSPAPAAAAPPEAEPSEAAPPAPDLSDIAVPQHLITRLLEILGNRAGEEGVQEFRSIGHRSLFPEGRLDPSFQKLNFAPAQERASLYLQPPVILDSRPTGRRYLGSRSEREEGEEMKYVIARKIDLGGFGGQVRIFFPADGGPAQISGLSL